ncbi:hypothetical protein ABBQ38_006258 [Trebouxia sp. C0009 RCD-2024]
MAHAPNPWRQGVTALKMVSVQDLAAIAFQYALIRSLLVVLVKLQVTSHKSKLGAARIRVAELQAELESQQQQHSVTTDFHLSTHAQTFWLKIDVTAHRCAEDQCKHI